MKRVISLLLCFSVLLSVFAVQGCANAENIYSEYFYGDVDRDGEINLTDALLILKNNVGAVSFDSEQKLLSDVDLSGKTDAADALSVLRYSVRLINIFKAGAHPVIEEKPDTALGLDESKSYKVTAYNKVLNLTTPDANYQNIQGGYFDGETYVVALTKGSMRTNNECGIIAKYDKTGKLLKSSSELAIEHGNNITYIPSKNAYMVSHCQPGWNVYSMVDADTLKITETKSLTQNFFSIAYCPELDMYASGYAGGEKIHTWDSELKLVNEFNVPQPTSLSQGVYCDSDYIYFVRSYNSGDTWSEIRMYNWNGELKFQIDLDRWNSWSVEPEGISVVDGKIYVIARENGIAVYQIDIAEDNQ